MPSEQQNAPEPRKCFGCDAHSGLRFLLTKCTRNSAGYSVAQPMSATERGQFDLVVGYQQTSLVPAVSSNEVIPKLEKDSVFDYRSEK